MGSLQNFPLAGSKFGIIFDWWLWRNGAWKSVKGWRASHNSTVGGCGSDLTTIEETEGILGSDLTCGEAGGSSQNYSAVDTTSLVSLREEDIPGASLNGRHPSQLHVVELKLLFKCRGATTAGRKEDLVKWLE